MMSEEMLLEIIENLNRNSDNKIKSVHQYFQALCVNEGIKYNKDILDEYLLMLMCIGYDAALADVTASIPTKSSITEYLN